MVAGNCANKTPYGQIEIVPGGSRFTPDRPARESPGHITYRWSPPEVLEQQLPACFVLEMSCVMGADGKRRIFPLGNHESFICKAIAGGLAILNHQLNWDAHTRWSYRMMTFLFQRVRRQQEHLARQFQYGTDLRIRRTGRGLLGTTDILPVDLGLNNLGQGRRWAVQTLLDEGKCAARESGIPNPTMKDVIHHGLYKAACLNPLKMSRHEIPGLIRSALFTEGPLSEPLDRESEQQITERFLDAFQNHLDDDPQTFEKWYMGAKSGLFHQIAKQKRRPGGVFSSNQVRQAFLELGWQAYEYVASCLHAQMYWFRQSLPDPLTIEERRQFDAMYASHPSFANLPLILLAERLPFLAIPFGKMCDCGIKRDDVAVAHRLLLYYRDMTRNRRDADRETQRFTQHRREHGGVIVSLDQFENEFETDRDDSGFTRGRFRRH